MQAKIVTVLMMSMQATMPLMQRNGHAAHCPEMDKNANCYAFFGVFDPQVAYFSPPCIIVTNTDTAKHHRCLSDTTQ